MARFFFGRVLLNMLQLLEHSDAAWHLAGLEARGIVRALFGASLDPPISAASPAACPQQLERLDPRPMATRMPQPCTVQLKAPQKPTQCWTWPPGRWTRQPRCWTGPGPMWPWQCGQWTPCTLRPASPGGLRSAWLPLVSAPRRASQCHPHRHTCATGQALLTPAGG